MPDRSNQLKILLSDDEVKMVRDLAERRGLNVADYLRTLIRQENEAATALEKNGMPMPHSSTFTAGFAQAAAAFGFAAGRRARDKKGK